MPNMLRFWIIFHALPFPVPPYSPFFSPLFSVTSSLLFKPCRPVPMEMNKKLNYCASWKHTNAVPSANMCCFFPYTNREWLKASCCQWWSVLCLSVCLSVTNLWMLYFKTNEPISIQIGINLPLGKGMDGRPWGSWGQRSRSEETEVMFGSLAGTSFSIPWVE